jgi:hypothetical protein
MSLSLSSLICTVGMITGPIAQGLHDIGEFLGTQETLKDLEEFLLYWVLHFGFLKQCTNISVILVFEMS